MNKFEKFSGKPQLDTKMLTRIKGGTGGVKTAPTRPLTGIFNGAGRTRPLTGIFGSGKSRPLTGMY